MGTLVSFVAPVPFYFLELFVGFIQALVFAILTLVFLTMATESHHSNLKSLHIMEADAIKNIAAAAAIAIGGFFRRWRLENRHEGHGIHRPKSGIRQ